MKRYIKSSVKFHRGNLGGYVADNGYSIETNGRVGGMGIYVVRDPSGKKVETSSSLAEAKQIIIDIAEGRYE
jgi:hypothetical protein